MRLLMFILLFANSACNTGEQAQLIDLSKVKAEHVMLEIQEEEEISQVDYFVQQLIAQYRGQKAPDEMRDDLYSCLKENSFNSNRDLKKFPEFVALALDCSQSKRFLSLSKENKLQELRYLLKGTVGAATLIYLENLKQGKKHLPEQIKEFLAKSVLPVFQALAELEPSKEDISNNFQIMVSGVAHAYESKAIEYSKIFTPEIRSVLLTGFSTGASRSLVSKDSESLYIADEQLTSVLSSIPLQINKFRDLLEIKDQGEAFELGSELLVSLLDGVNEKIADSPALSISLYKNLSNALANDNPDLAEKLMSFASEFLAGYPVRPVFKINSGDLGTESLDLKLFLTAGNGAYAEVFASTDCSGKEVQKVDSLGEEIPYIAITESEIIRLSAIIYGKKFAEGNLDHKTECLKAQIEYLSREEVRVVEHISEANEAECSALFSGVWQAGSCYALPSATLGFPKRIDGQIVLSWDVLDGAAQYVYNISDGELPIEGEYTYLNPVGHSILTTSVSLPLPANKTFQWWVKARNAKGDGVVAYGNFTTLLPESFSVDSASITSDTATLNWSEVSDALTYKIFWAKQADDFTEEKIFSVAHPITSQLLTGLEGESVYKLKVQILQGDLKGVVSTPIEFSTTEASIWEATTVSLLKLEAGSITPTAATVNWVKASNADNYEFFLNETLLGSLAASITNRDLTALTSYQNQKIQIVSLKNIPGKSAHRSAIVEYNFKTPPEPPTSLVFKDRVANNFAVTWDAFGAVEEYNVYIKEKGDASFAASVLHKGEPYEHSFDVEPNHSYTVCIKTKGVNSDATPLESACSLLDDVKTPMVAAAGLSLKSKNHERAFLEWTYPTEGVKFSVELDEATGDFSDPISSVVQLTKSLNPIDLTAETNYKVRVKALHTSGEEALESAPIELAFRTLPTPVGGLFASSIAHNEAVVQWAEVIEAGYVLQVREGDVTADFDDSPMEFTLDAGITEYRIDSLKPITRYAYRVKAGDAEFSEPAGFRTTLGATASGNTHNSVTINWPEIGGLEVVLSIPDMDDEASETNSYRYDGILEALSSYTVTLAVDGYSEALTFSTHLAPAEGLSHSSLKSDEVIVSWDEVSGESYVLEVKEGDASADFSDSPDVYEIDADTMEKRLIDLKPVAQYAFRVKAGTAKFSSPAVFSTILGASFTDETHDSVTIEWPDIDGQEVVLEIDGLTDVVTTGTSHIYAADLTPSTDYTVTVNVGDYSESLTFSTIAAPVTEAITQGKEYTLIPKPGSETASVYLDAGSAQLTNGLLNEDFVGAKDWSGDVGWDKRRVGDVVNISIDLGAEAFIETCRIWIAGHTFSGISRPASLEFTVGSTTVSPTSIEGYASTTRNIAEDLTDHTYTEVAIDAVGNRIDIEFEFQSGDTNVWVFLDEIECDGAFE